LLQSCRIDDQPRYLIGDRDAIYGETFQPQVRALQIEDIPTAPQSPWQNPYAERVIGSIRRECLDHVIVLSVAHLGRMLSRYAAYYNGARTHLSLYKDSPAERAIQKPEMGAVRELEYVGGTINMSGWPLNRWRMNKH